MPRSIGNNKFAFWRCKVAVGYIDCDTLLALGAQAVCQQGEIDIFIAARFRILFYRFELVLKYCFAIV